MKRLLLVLTILANMFLGGCISEELTDIGIAVSVGIDKSEDGYLVTYQVMNPKAISSKAPNEAPVVLYTESGKDLFQIKRKITQQSPRKMYHSHLRTVIFSEEIAKEGIKDMMDFFVRGHEYRTDFYFLIAKGTTAHNILKVITPFESVPQMEVYNALERSQKNWAPTKTIKIYELINKIISDGDNPVIPGVEIIDPKDKSDSNDNLKLSDATKLRVTSLGAFKKDKFVGWLTEDESRGYNYIVGNVESTAGYAVYEENRISAEVFNVKMKRKVYILNGKPAINVEINWIQDISAITGDLDITDEDVIEKFNVKAEEKLTNLCKDVLKAAKEDFRTDIFGFGEDIHRAYPKLWKDMKDDWNNEFTELPVSFKVKVKLNNLGASTKSVFSKGD
ncbi:Ger(x)C family spore germination protein [Acetivibrio cellulolyticus]|uniref:Ger(x)C family spore germination protein n=1 Tax=Acetivibrio cellulolyticus TaxID=35830 RepID=UPI0001E2D490|nr:Ger(x)C family spore germination protein [Acetivibrio cellulolyticus]